MNISLTKLRVFLVDDNVTLRATLRDWLSSTVGIDIVGESGEANHAIKQIPDIAPDVVLLDVSLSSGDNSGLDVLKIIKRSWPGIRVVLLSSKPEVELAAFMRNFGADAFVNKARLMDQLLPAIRLLVKRT